jgi:hypothetical protein
MERRMRSKSRARRFGSALIFVACFALVSLAPRRARADFVEEVAIGVLVFTAVAGSDILFTTYDAVVASNGELPSRGWAIAELVVTAPQPLLITGVTTWLTLSKEPEINSALIPLGALPGALTTHAIWSLVPSRVSPSTLFFASPGIASNTMFTASAVAALFTERRVFTRAVGVAEVVLTLPSVIGGSVRLATDASHRPGWTAYTAWSGALLLHGVASIAAGGGDSEGESSSARPYRRAAVAPRVVAFGPAPIGLDVELPPSPGLAVRGVF